MPISPAVSVIVPAYNVAPYIVEALESLFAQTFQDFEVILVNDGSTDETEARIAPFLGRLSYIAQPNRGVMAARNAGLRAARGRFIALLDGDDVWLPRFLEVLVGMLEADAGVGAAFPNALYFGWPRHDGKLHQDAFPVAEPVTFDRVLRRECYVFGQLVFRREMIDDIGGYDESLRGQGAEDFELWLRMLKHGYRFRFTRQPLVKYRWRHDSLSNTGVKIMSCEVSVYEKLLRGELTNAQRDWIESRLPELRARLSYACFKEELSRRRFHEAERHLTAASEYYRRPKLRLLRAAMKVAPRVIARLAGI